MRIVIDMQGAQNGSRYRGIGRYTTAFAKHLIREAKEHDVLLVLNGAFKDTIEPIRLEFSALLPQASILVWEPICPVHFLDQKNDGRRLASEALREVFLTTLAPDVVIITSMFEGAGDNVVSSIGSYISTLPTAVILYDFIPLIYSKEYLADVRVNSWYMDKLHQMMKADLLLSISESSRNEGLEHLGFTSDAVVNISTAIESNFASATGAPQAHLATKFGLTRPYLMYSGASDPRKNLPRLLEAYSTLVPTVRKKHQLLLAGGMPQNHIDALKRHMEKLHLREDEVRFTGHITDDEMIGLYKGALGFVFASYHEGFGLPILEAMAFDVPVIGSNISSIPEVIGNVHALFDPFSIPSISAAMHKLLTDASFRGSLGHHAKKQRSLFSWKITATKALQAIVEKFGATGRPKNPYYFLPTSTQQRLLASYLATVLTKRDVDTEELFHAAALVDYVLPRNDKPHRLFVDVSELKRTDSKTGIQRVVSNIYSNLFKQAPSNFQVVPVYATRTDEYKVANSFMCHFLGFDSTLETDHVLDFRSGDVFFGLDYQDQLIYDRRDYYDQLRHRGVAVYFVVYDLLPQLLEGTFVDEVTHNHAAWLKTVAKADGLICISRSVAEELHHWLTMFGPERAGPLQIGWFHLGADFTQINHHKTSDQNQQTVLSKIAAQQSFLMVSTIEPRKCQSQVLKGFELLWSQGENVCLVLVGKRGWMVNDLINQLETHQERDKRLFWLEGIDDQYLNDVYAASSCLIAASLGEGFGLSLIEAAHHNIPIIARDIPVFREVAGQHATYFTGTDGSSIAAVVQRWRKLMLTNNAPQSAGMPLLSWQQSADQLVDVLFHQHWYSKWHHDGIVRYCGADKELGTEIGRRVRFEMQSTGQQGYLLFGPYIDLKPGDYQVQLSGKAKFLGITSCHVDVASGGGKCVHGSAVLTQSEEEGILATVSLALDENVSNVEVRVWVSEGANITVKMIQVIPAKLLKV
jgi:glycosyltransferase involved in cell wall biosynthesis